MLVRNGVWARIRPEFSETQQDAIERAAKSDSTMPNKLRVDEHALPAWLADKLRAAIARIEVGA